MDTAIAEEMRPLLLELLGVPVAPQNPYPKYHELREVAPIYKDDLLGAWLLTRYDDCAQALRDPRLGRPPVGAGPAGMGSRAAERQHTSMLLMNPPEHTRQRALVNRGFTPRRVETMRPHIIELTDACLDRIADERDVDLMDLLAFPLPVAVIGELVGVPREDQQQFRTVAQDLTATLDPIQSDETFARVEAAVAIFTEYFTPLIAARRTQPRDDLMSVLVQKSEHGELLSEEEILANTILLFAAGFETTTNLIGSGMLALLQHPDELERLRDHRNLMPSAIEEMLRFESPVQLDVRYGLQDSEVGGRAIAAGETLITFLSAANRDPAQFTDPDRFDITRDQGAALSFGGGIHYCLGAALARLEAEVAFGRLLDRFSAFELKETPTFRPSIALRGVQSLRVHCTPA